MPQHGAERLWWQVARRDAARLARHLYRPQVVDGVARWDDGAVLDDVCHVLEQGGVMAWRAEVHGAGIQRDMRPCSPDGLRDRLKTLLGMERIRALPALLCSDDALMPLVGFHAQHVRDGGCQGGRPRGRTSGRQGRAAPPPWPRTS